MHAVPHIGRRLLLALLLVVTTSVAQASAQVSFRTTLIGEVEGGTASTFRTDTAVMVSFRTRALPSTAMVTAATLQLTAANMLEASDVTIGVAWTSLPEPNRGSRSVPFGK